MNEDSVEFPLFNHRLRFNLAQDITLHEFVEICLNLNGIPLARSEIGISLPCLDFTPELIAQNDVQEMINENPDEVYMSKGEGELLFLVDNVECFEPEGFSEKEYDTIITVLSIHGFVFNE